MPPPPPPVLVRLLRLLTSVLTSLCPDALVLSLTITNVALETLSADLHARHHAAADELQGRGLCRHLFRLSAAADPHVLSLTLWCVLLHEYLPAVVRGARRGRKWGEGGAQRACAGG